jgi:hypothetical protein
LSASSIITSNDKLSSLVFLARYLSNDNSLARRFFGGSLFANGASSSLLSSLSSSNSFDFFFVTFGVSRDPKSGVSNVAGVNIARLND